MSSLVVTEGKTVAQDFGQPLAYDLVYETFFVGTANYLGSKRSVAQGIKLFHDTYGYKSKLVPFVTYLPIEALAICFTAVSCLNHVVVLSEHHDCISQLKHTLDMRAHGFFDFIAFDASHYLAFYKAIRALLYAKAKSHKSWAKRYLLDSVKAQVLSYPY